MGMAQSQSAGARRSIPHPASKTALALSVRQNLKLMADVLCNGERANAGLCLFDSKMRARLRPTSGEGNPKG
jgi:hypothetical protein